MAFRPLHDRVGIISANGYREVGEKIANDMDKVGKEPARVWHGWQPGPGRPPA